MISSAHSAALQSNYSYLIFVNQLLDDFDQTRPVHQLNKRRGLAVIMPL